MLLVPTRLAQSPIHGFGVAFDPGIVETLPEHVRAFFSHYGYLDRNVKRIILCFDDARFVNHSDTPNVATDYAQDSYGLDVALRDIAAGEELTMNYEGFEESAARGF